MRKEKICSKCSGRLYAKGLCRYHYYVELRKRSSQKKKNKTSPRKYVRRARSRKYLYKVARKAFFQIESNQLCKVRVDGICNIHATDVHHMAGRVGELLTNTTYFLPVCRMCHRYLHDNQKWAEENGFIIHLN